MFLSAEPDHWCKVPEVLDPGFNLTVDQIKALTIPRVDLGPGREDIVLYKRCKQFDVNFTELLEQHGGHWPTEADPDWPVAKCKNGWVYDKSEYENTLVTEVSR